MDNIYILSFSTYLLLFYMFPITLSSLFEKNYNIKERSA